MLPVLHLRLVFLLLLLVSFLTSLVKVGKVALPVVQALRVLVDNVGRDGIEECSVVRSDTSSAIVRIEPGERYAHNEDGTGPGLEIVFEPSNGVQIQHVRRLVQHEELYPKSAI